MSTPTKSWHLVLPFASVQFLAALNCGEEGKSLADRRGIMNIFCREMLTKVWFYLLWVGKRMNMPCQIKGFCEITNQGKHSKSWFGYT